MDARYRAADVAAFIVQLALEKKRPVSNLQLQKILFFVQRDYVREHGGRPLFEDDFEAWQYGPVVPSVYMSYSVFGGSPITKPALYKEFNIFSGENESIAELDEDSKAFVERVVDMWIDKPAWSLVSESHKRGEAWDRVYNKEGCEGAGYRDVIPLELMGA